MRHLRGYLDRDAVRADEPLTFVAATEGLKADGLDLRMDRVKLDRYLANPVVMYGHRYGGRDNLPIGRSEKVEVDGAKLLSDISFDLGDDFATSVDRKYRDGFLNAVSIGFDFGTVDPLGVPDWWELLEISAVPIPLDADAVLEDGRDQELILARAVAGFRDDSLLELVNGFRTTHHASGTNTATNLQVDDASSEQQGTSEEQRTSSLDIRRRRLRTLTRT